MQRNIFNDDILCTSTHMSKNIPHRLLLEHILWLSINNAGCAPNHQHLIYLNRYQRPIFYSIIYDYCKYIISIYFQDKYGTIF